MSKENKILVVCAQTAINLHHFKDYFKIGVERGAIALLNQNITPDFVTCDFDSVTPEEKELIYQSGTQIDALHREKDYLDSELAIKAALKYQPTVLHFIAQGMRADMELACFGFLLRYPFMVYQNDYTYAYLLQKGENIIFHQKGYRYVSFLTFSQACISIKNMKYNVNNFKLETLTGQAISNELLQTDGVIDVHNGQVIVIYSK